jgi:hypothetical protein
MIWGYPHFRKPPSCAKLWQAIGNFLLQGSHGRSEARDQRCADEKTMGHLASIVPQDSYFMRKKSDFSCDFIGMQIAKLVYNFIN